MGALVATLKGLVPRDRKAAEAVVDQAFTAPSFANWAPEASHGLASRIQGCKALGARNDNADLDKNRENTLHLSTSAVLR